MENVSLFFLKIGSRENCFHIQRRSKQASVSVRFELTSPAGKRYVLTVNSPSRKANSSTASIALSETQEKGILISSWHLDLRPKTIHTVHNLYLHKDMGFYANDIIIKYIP